MPSSDAGGPGSNLFEMREFIFGRAVEEERTAVASGREVRVDRRSACVARRRKERERSIERG